LAGMGIEVTLIDPLAPRIAEAVGQAGDPATIVERLLGVTEMFGDLGDDVALRDLLAAALTQLTRGGALAALRNAIEA